MTAEIDRPLWGVISLKDSSEKFQEKMETQLQEKKEFGPQAFNSLVGKAKSSRAEILVRTFFKHYFPKEIVFYNYRPDWLKNGKTGYNLELDIFYPNLNLAIEFQGLHHQLENQVDKDNFKKKKCEELNINLIFIWNVWELLKVRTYLGLKQIPRWFRWELKKYKMSKGGKTGKYIKFTKWKLKNEKGKRIQNEEIAYNKRKLERKNGKN